MGEHVLGGGAAGPLDHPEQPPTRGGGLQGGELGAGERLGRHRQRGAAGRRRGGCGRRRRHGLGLGGRWRRWLGHDRFLRIALRRCCGSFGGHRVGVVAEPIQRVGKTGQAIARRGRAGLGGCGDGDERDRSEGQERGETHYSGSSVISAAVWTCAGPGSSLGKQAFRGAEALPAEISRRSARSRN